MRRRLRKEEFGGAVPLEGQRRLNASSTKTVKHSSTFSMHVIVEDRSARSLVGLEPRARCAALLLMVSLVSTQFAHPLKDYTGRWKSYSPIKEEDNQASELLVPATANTISPTR